MTRKAPTLEVLRPLFARSGNQCAFPGCTNPLVNNCNESVAQICHIEAASPGGQRYNKKQTDEERRSYDNLILLCYAHHVETDDVEMYSVLRLKEIKLLHESNFGKDFFKIDESLLYKLMFEMEEYWSEIDILNSIKHICTDFAVPIKAKGTFFDVIKDANALVEDINEIKQYLERSDKLLIDDMLKFLKKLDFDTAKIEQIEDYRNPFWNRNWEMYNIRFYNDIAKLRINLLQLELKYLEEYVKTNTKDFIARSRLNVLKEEFKTIAQTSGLAD